MSSHGKGELASIYHRYYSRCLEISYSMAPVSKLLTAISKIMQPVSLRLKSQLGILVNRLPKIQTEAEFSELMSEHFGGFLPCGRTSNCAHGGKGPFRISYETPTKLVSLHQKLTSKFVLAKSQVRCCTYQHPHGTPLHKRVGVHAWNFENDCYKIIKGT